VLWRARVSCGCEAGYEVLSEHGSGSGEEEDTQSWRHCATILLPLPRACGPEGESPIAWGPSERTRWKLGQRVVGEGHGHGER